MDTKAGEYLYHHSHLGEFFLSSDAVVPDWSGRREVAPYKEHYVGDRCQEASVVSRLAMSLS